VSQFWLFFDVCFSVYDYFHIILLLLKNSGLRITANLEVKREKF